MKLKLCLYFWLCVATINAQSSKGLTGIPDTSYSTYSALTKTLKTHPNAVLIPEKRFKNVQEHRNISYVNVGTRDLHLDVFHPQKRSKKGQPAILIIHGGGWRTGNRAMHIPLAQHLAARGYVTITAEYRLSTEALYPAAVHDLKAAIRWIRANANLYNIDSQKVIGLGFSAGGQLAALLGNTNHIQSFEGSYGNLNHSSALQTIVDIDGILAYIHPESGEGDDSRNTSAATNWFGYSKTENPDLWKAASALTHAGKNSPPTLFLNSSVDRMHAGRENYMKKLDIFKIYSEVHTFEGSPHGFCLFAPWFEPMLGYIDDFLKKTIPK
jgi:pectinesterase